MHRSWFTASGTALLLLILGLNVARAQSGLRGTPGIRVAVIDFTYVDTSGEVTDQTAAHDRRLRVLMAALRHDLSADRRFRLVPVACAAAPCSQSGTTPAELARAASRAGARILVLGGIHKQSTLVQWARIQAVDLGADHVVFDKLFTFRGDSDEAWQRAETFMVSELRAALPAQ